MPAPRFERVAGIALDAIPCRPGTYALVLECAVPARVRIGRLGYLDARPGFYVYAGSALGPGGLRARIRRHLDPARARHWHIDYVKRALRIVAVWYRAAPRRFEHEWARRLAAMPGASVPLARFGASDCGCAAHLAFFAAQPSPVRFARAAGPVAALP